MDKEQNLEQELNEEIIDEVIDETTTEQTIEEEIQVEDVVEETNEEKLEKENADLKDKLMRSAAEFDNFRKRTIKEKQTMYSDGVRDVVEKLLAITDNFERAMNSQGIDKEDNFYVGMDMIYKQFQNMLTDLGVEELGAIGEEFDPNFHFAVAKEDNEAFGENQISEILQKGYKLKDKVIRPTMVKVAN